MSDAPERIWADCQIEYEGNRNNYHHSWDDDGPRELFHEEWCIGPTEYIRADIHTTSIAKLDAIRDFINGQTKHNCGLIRTLKEMLNEN